MESKKDSTPNDATAEITTTGHKELPTQSISTAFRACLDSFRLFILALDEESSRGGIEFDVTRLMEEYGRLKIWGDQSGAHLPVFARGSLDDTLRQDEQLQQLTMGILESMKLAADDAAHIITHGAIPGHEDSSDSDDSLSDLSSDSGSNVDLTSDTGKTKMITQICEEIFGQVRSLFDLSSLLRRPRIKDRYIRSARRDTTPRTSSRPDNMTITDALSAADQDHVVEKILQWRGLTKSGGDCSCATEMAIPGDHHANHRVSVEQWLVERLARANTRRREQLYYWIQHPYSQKASQEPAVQSDHAEIPLHLLNPAPLLNEQGVAINKPNVGAPRPITPSQAGKSAVTRTTFSAAPVSVVLGTKTNIRPRTQYAKTTVGQARTNSVPKPPKVKPGQTSFHCPYCGTALDADEMQDDQCWKRHVFRDLRPYVCTFEMCQNPEKLYISRHEWRHHEFQIHRREYKCKQCGHTTLSREDMAVHLGTHSQSDIPAHRLRILLDLCERQMDDSRQRMEDCLICGEQQSLSRLHNHIAQHMESLALFVLPSAESKNDDDVSHCSSNAARRQSQADRSQDLDSEVSTGIPQTYESLASDIPGHVNNLQQFKMLFKQLEQSHTDRISSWNVGDESNRANLDTDDNIQDGATEALTSPLGDAPTVNSQEPGQNDGPESLQPEQTSSSDLAPPDAEPSMGPVDKDPESKAVVELLEHGIDHCPRKEQVKDLLEFYNNSLRDEHDLDQSVYQCGEIFMSAISTLGPLDPITLGFMDLTTSLLLRTKRQNLLEEWLLTIYLAEQEAGLSASTEPLMLIMKTVLYVRESVNNSVLAFDIYTLWIRLTSSPQVRTWLREDSMRTCAAKGQLAGALLGASSFEEAVDILQDNTTWYKRLRSTEAKKAEMINNLNLAGAYKAAYEQRHIKNHEWREKRLEDAELCCQTVFNMLKIQPGFGTDFTISTLTRIYMIVNGTELGIEACRKALELRRPSHGQEPSADFIRNMHRLVEQLNFSPPPWSSSSLMHAEAWSLDAKLRALVKRHRDLFSKDEQYTLGRDHITVIDPDGVEKPKLPKEVEDVLHIQGLFRARTPEVSEKLEQSCHQTQDWVPREDEAWTSKAIEALEWTLKALVNCIGEERCSNYQPYLQRQEDLGDVFCAIGRTPEAENLYTKARDGFYRLPEREPDDVIRVDAKLSALQSGETGGQLQGGAIPA